MTIAQIDAPDVARGPNEAPQPTGQMARVTERVLLALIDPNPWQPREEMDARALETLMRSIEEEGLVQTPLARRTEDGRYQLAFGHRRIEAIRLLRQEGKWPDSVDLDIADLSDRRMMSMALAENERRADLNQIELLRAYQKAMTDFGISVGEFAPTVQMSRPNLSNQLRVLKLPEYVLKHVRSGALGINVARDLLAFVNDDHIHEAELKRVIERIERNDGHPGMPDWSRNNVREKIYETVAFSANHPRQDGWSHWRPLAPRPRPELADKDGAQREPSFDVDEFHRQHKECSHSIPSPTKLPSPGSYRHGDSEYEISRRWTCATAEWTRAQTQATREANRAERERAQAAASGRSAPDLGGSAAPVRHHDPMDEMLADAMHKDPLWLQIVGTTEEGAPGQRFPGKQYLPAVHREALGTRADLVRRPGYADFWRAVKKYQPASRYELDRHGSGMPPWIADIEGCRKRCNAGAAYAYANGEVKLGCFNEACFDAKVERGAEKLRQEQGRQRASDEIEESGLIRELSIAAREMPEGARDMLAWLLMRFTRDLETVKPLGFRHSDFDYPTMGASLYLDLLQVQDMPHGPNYAPDRWYDEMSEEGRSMALAALAAHYLKVFDSVGKFAGTKGAE